MKPDDKILMDNLGIIAYTLDKAYIPKLCDDYRVLCFDDKYNKDEIVCYEGNIRAIKINQWIFDKEQSVGDCFKNVLSLFADGDHTIALVIKRTTKILEMYFVVKNDGLGRNEDSRSNVELLNDSLQGNFQGTDTTIIKNIDELKSIFSFSDANSISILSNLPSEYSEKHITQGIEKLINGIVPQKEDDSYSVVFLAESLSQDRMKQVLSSFEDLATDIYPYMEHQDQEGSNETTTDGVIRSVASTDSISDTVFKTHSINIGMNGSASGDIGNDLSATLGISSGYGYSWGKSRTNTSGKTTTTGSSNSISKGTSKNKNYTYKSYMVSNLIDKLEMTMERINKNQSIGLWKFATYVFAPNSKTSKNVANYLRGLSQGKDSYTEPAFINEWFNEKGNPKCSFSEIRKYIIHFTHPVFFTRNQDDNKEMLVTPTSYVATDELAYIISAPRKSVSGLPVIECAEFGRDVMTYNAANTDTKSKIYLGNIFHMNRVENNEVLLDKNSLASHTFITGSTGSGKSNTVYKILDNARHKGAKFLVVEPAKGEYKYVFGKDKDVSVYSTNPEISPLLRINPFSFPKGIHILEHLDRLVEIFNVCWPMYAAMPAVLKNAVEKSYEDCGWNLTESENVYGENLYPKFSDVARNVKTIIDSSEYDTDNKGAYKGSLLTRLNSLTNGINGLIFTDDELPAETLFDENVIVDLSRVGSSETKSLIMGMLVLKLQEYRMVQGEMNAPLKHITVLEEAHNLLKRTSTEQTSEGANLLGKSVEMIANAIAEMRTYGEGFIIADQSPGLLDMSVIRNTNTKIIMRLPDLSDRELVGKAANLNDNQITELAKLPCGVAAVYQNEWIQPVLCKIEKYSSSNEGVYTYQRDKSDPSERKSDDMLPIAELLSNGTKLKPEKIIKDILPKLRNNGVDASVQVAVAKQLENPPKEPRMTKLAPIMSAMFPKVKSAVVTAYNDNPEAFEWTNCAELALLKSLTNEKEINDRTRRDIIQAVITDYVYVELGNKADMQKWAENGGLR